MPREAKFGPVIPEILPPDYGSRSQGIRADADTGVADAFGQLGKLGVQTVVAVDQNIQQNIRNDTERGFDDVSREFGVDAAALLETDIDDPEQPLPFAVKDSQRLLEGLKEQYVQGKSTERHYFARLQSMVRQLRGKYPGYREQIDGIVANVTGVRPANALQAELFNEAQASLKSADDYGKFVEKAGMDGSLQPDFYDRAAAGDPYTQEETRRYAYNKNAERAEISARSAAMDLRTKTGNVIEDDAVTLYKDELVADSNGALYDASTIIGKNYQATVDMIQKATTGLASGKTPAPEELAAIASNLNNLEMTMRKQAEEKFRDPSKPYAANIKDKKKVDEAISLAMGPIQLLRDAFQNEKNPWSVARATSSYLEAMSDANTKKILQDVPVLQRVQAFQKATSPELVSLYLTANPAVRSALAASLVDNHIAKAHTDPEHSATAAFTELDIQKAPREAAQALIAQFTKVAEMATKGEIPPEEFAKDVNFWFGPKNIQLMSTLKPADRATYFKAVTNPVVARAMATMKNEGHTQAYETYKTWTTTAFKSLFRDEVQELQQYQIDNQKLDIQYDKTSNRFVTVPNPDAPKDRSAVAHLMMDLNTADRAMTTMNDVIASVVPIIQSEGMETSEQLAGLLAEMGLDLDVKQTGWLGDQLWEAVQTFRKKIADKAGPNKDKAAVSKLPNIWEESGAITKRFRRVEDRTRIVPESEKELRPDEIMAAQ